MGLGHHVDDVVVSLVPSTNIFLLSTATGKRHTDRNDPQNRVRHPKGGRSYEPTLSISTSFWF
jgi:hypothetical protein